MSEQTLADSVPPMVPKSLVELPLTHDIESPSRASSLVSKISTMMKVIFTVINLDAISNGGLRNPSVQTTADIIASASYGAMIKDFNGEIQHARLRTRTSFVAQKAFTLLLLAVAVWLFVRLFLLFLAFDFKLI